jgi:anti-sigma B factor antagonist
LSLASRADTALRRCPSVNFLCAGGALAWFHIAGRLSGRITSWRFGAGEDSAFRGEHVDLTLATREVDGTTIVAVGGEIDVYTAPKLRDKITELVADGIYDLIVDMEAVEFLDSTGLGVLVGGLKKVRAHDGSLQLVCTQDRLLKIFRITGLAKVFVIHDSAESALSNG